MFERKETFEDKNTYTVTIEETLSHQCEVNADSQAEAIEKVNEQYRLEHIILDSSNHVETNIFIAKS